MLSGCVASETEKMTELLLKPIRYTVIEAKLLYSGPNNLALGVGRNRFRNLFKKKKERNPE